MKTISMKAVLSTLYTNYSIRATCITCLDQRGIEVRYQVCQWIQVRNFNQELFKICDQNKKAGNVPGIVVCCSPISKTRVRKFNCVNEIMNITKSAFKS